MAVNPPTAKRRTKPLSPVAAAVHSPDAVVACLGESDAEWVLVRSWVESAFSLADDRSRAAVGRVALAFRRLTRVEQALDLAGGGGYAEGLRAAAARKVGVAAGHRTAVSLLAATDPGPEPVDELTAELVWTAACEVRDGSGRPSVVTDAVDRFLASRPDPPARVAGATAFAGWTAALLRAGVAHPAGESGLAPAEFSQRVTAWFTVRVPFLEARAAFARALSAEADAVPGIDPRPRWRDYLPTASIEFVDAMGAAAPLLARRDGGRRKEGHAC